jgi:FKBP-type peptidyl-prolyl cis-trans isomerase SlyD
MPQMKVGPGTMVTMDYTMPLDSGQIVDSSEGRDRLVVHFGQGQVIPGLERELAGLQSGDEKEIRVEPEDAYGVRQSEAIHQIRLDRFPEDITPTVGMHLTVREPRGEDVLLNITAVSGSEATADCNHPLDGETLTFSVTVRNVQPTGNER